jgi:hypothetical protein
MNAMTHFRRHTRKKLTAQGLLEFALILPILLLLMFGIIDLGWMAFNFSQLYNATRESARFGSVPGFPPVGGQFQYLDCAGIRNRLVKQAGFSGIQANWTQIKLYYDDGRPTDGSAVVASGTNAAEVVGTCDGAFAQNSAYRPEGAVANAPRNVANGDRITVVVDVWVPFLTPFIKSLAPQGVWMSFTVARSVFPGGLAA